MKAQSPFDIAEYVRVVMLDALEVAERPPVEHSIVALGEVPIDTCRMLAVGVELTFRYLPGQFPAPATVVESNADGSICWGGFIGLQVVVVITGCIPVPNDEGHGPSADEMNAAHQSLWLDGATIFNAVGNVESASDEWAVSNAAMTPGAPSGGIGLIEVRFSIATDLESWCPTHG